MKRYKDDWAKSKSRDMLRDSIERNLLSFMRPQDVKVLCFPGIDGAEIIEVYDRLGIPRSNITGLELFPNIAEQIRAGFPDIKLHTTSLEEYVNSEKKRLRKEVMSLDFTSCIHLDAVGDATKLGVSNQANNFIYHIAFQGKRESKDAQEVMALASVQVQFGASISGYGKDISGTEGMDKEERLRTQRSHTLLSIMSSARSRANTRDENLEVVKRILGSSYRTYAVQFIQKLLKQSLSDEDRSELTNSLTLPDPMQSRIAFNLGLYELTRISHKCLETSIGSQFATSGTHFSQEVLQNVASIVYRAAAIRTSGSYYRFMDYQKYAYISESSTPMIGDIVFMQNDIRSLGLYEQIFDCFDLRTFKITDFQKLKLVSNKISSHLRLKIENGEEKGTFRDPRIYLGSSAKPVLRISKARELLLAGNTPRELFNQYRGMSLMQIAAVKSHITMGTYSQGDEPTSVTAALQEDLDNRVTMANEGINIGNTEEISREDCIDFLVAGIPPKEIHTAYPGTSLPTINAWDYWRKQGRYEFVAK